MVKNINRETGEKIMKKRNISDYRTIISPPGIFVPGCSAWLRKAGSRIGYLFFCMLVLTAFYTITALGTDMKMLTNLNKFMVFYAALMSIITEKNDAKKFRPFGRQNMFYCMIPDRDRVLKKAFVCYEMYVAVNFAVFAAAGELLGYAGGGSLRPGRALTGCLVFYTVSCVIRYFIRTNNILLIFISGAAGFVIAVTVTVGFQRMDYEWAGNPFWYKWWTCLLVSVLAVISGVYLTIRTYWLTVSAVTKRPEEKL